jgi:hypothetical protein
MDRADAGEEGSMKKLTKKLACIVASIVVGLCTVGVTAVWAFDCPNANKAVMAYYEKTSKLQGVDQAKLAQAKQMLDDAMKQHEGGNHRASMDETADAMKLITQSRP